MVDHFHEKSHCFEMKNLYYFVDSYFRIKKNATKEINMPYPKEFLFSITFALLILLLVILGCSKKSTAPSEADQDAILSLIESYPKIFTPCVIDTIPDSSGMGKIVPVTEDTVIFWWRWIYWGQTVRSIEVDVYPSGGDHLYPYANVTVIDTLIGDLHLIRKDTSGIWSSKPITDVAKRSAYFERRRPIDSPHRGWDVVKVSGLLVQSVPTTRAIDSLHIASTKTGYDTTITESHINQCTLIWNLLTFGEEDSITVTVYTGDPTDSAYLHAYSHLFPHLFHVRSAFVNNGDGSFSGTWVTAELPFGASPYRHAAIDVIKHSTLDGEDPYDSEVWGVIYRIEGKEF